MEACLCAAFFMASCLLVLSKPSCDQTQFLHPNGTCVDCPVCGPGEQLSEDCGFGDGGDGVCVPCAEGAFSAEVGLAPCRRCTKCSLLNRQERAACSPVSNTLCGHCLVGYYELRSMTGETELSCLPCYSMGTIRRECLLLQDQTSKAESAQIPRRGAKEHTEKRTTDDSVSMALVGSATAVSSFLLILMLWTFLLALERFKKVPEYWQTHEGLFSETDLSPQTQLSGNTETDERPAGPPSQIPSPTEDPHRCLNSLSHENESHPTSIVINVTTNIKPSNQDSDESYQGHGGTCHLTEEMEEKLHKIWEVAQGQSIEMLDYDTVQDLSLLLDCASRGSGWRRLGCSLGVPPQVLSNLHGFQELFQYLRTSTYILLPQLAQAAALLPSPEAVARIHRDVVNK